MKITDYLDLAKENRNLKSDLQLNRELGYKSNTVAYLRLNKSFPSDETMLKLADMANIEPTQALLDLNIWRSQGEAKTAYMTLYKAVEKAALICVALACFSPSPASAKVTSDNANNIYYGNSRKRKKRGLSPCF